MNTALVEDVTLATSGDRDAFSRLVQRHQSHVCSLALALTNNVAASEEIAQEAFVSAWQGLGELKQPSSFVPWLRQLVRRRAADFERTRYRHGRRPAAAEEALAQIADPGPAADRTLVSVEEQTALEEALDALASDDRELLLLYYREGRSAKEVAALVGISPAAAHKRIERARGKVRADVLERFSSAAEQTAPREGFAPSVMALLPGAGITKVAASSLAGAQVAPVVAKVGVAGKLAAFALWVAQPLGIVLWTDRYVSRELVDPSNAPEKERLRFRALYAACVVFWIAFPSWLASYAPFASAPKPLRVGVLLGLFALAMVSIRSLQPKLLRTVSPALAAREEAMQRSFAARLKMIPYAPALFAILLLGAFLPEVHWGHALHDARGARGLWPVLAVTLGVLLLVPVQRAGIRWLQARLSERAWAVASLALLFAVCGVEMFGLAAALRACSALLGG